MWLNGTPARIIAETLKISADNRDAIRRALGLPRRESWHRSEGGRRPTYLPSPDEIRRRCLEFQASWSDEERARRVVGGSQLPQPVEIKVIPESTFSQSCNGSSEISFEDFIDTSGG